MALLVDILFQETLALILYEKHPSKLSNLCHFFSLIYTLFNHSHFFIHYIFIYISLFSFNYSHGAWNSWDRNTYQAHSWDPTNLETLPITLDQNLFVNNYLSYFPVDSDDGSNAYIVSRNFLLWGGVKNLMGYNKAFLQNVFVYVDYSPITSQKVKDLGLSFGNHNKKYSNSSQQGGIGISSSNGYSTCVASIAPFASAELGLADQFRNNVCIASDKGHFFDWYNPCNKTNPTDGSMWLMSNNIYRSSDGGYVNRCDDVSWNLTSAQQLGVDVGSVATTLPSIDELVAIGHALLEF
jgi:hypothetical protein